MPKWVTPVVVLEVVAAVVAVVLKHQGGRRRVRS
jgi:hypothetical protein